MTNEIDFLTRLSNRTINYFEQELSINIDKDFTIEQVEIIDYADITALISLSKDMVGTVAMSVSNDLAFKIIENFIFGEMSKEELDELKDENIAETLNVTLGNILEELPTVTSGGRVEISIPYMMPKKVSVTKKEDGDMFICKLKLNDEIIILSYFI
ncbi:MAG: chemotaxis protein CheX [Arcobacteraceae bacterium]|nr:chemotaxis protein CheX [Arcobacteraceae bacterium]